MPDCGRRVLRSWDRATSLVMSELPNMGDAAIGTITAAVYSEHSNRPQNVQFVKAWKKGMVPIRLRTSWPYAAGTAWQRFSLPSRVDDTTGDAAMQVFQHWKNPDSPRGPISIDPATRDIVLNVYIDKVEKINGRLANVSVETIPAVKDQWKTLNPQ